MRSPHKTGIAVIGGGIVGASVAYGLAARGEKVTLFDEGDIAFRAARGNLGNVWVQGKGAGGPAYADLTRRAAKDWDDFAHDLGAESGIDLHFRRPGAFFFCFTEAELERRSKTLTDLDAQATVPSRFEVMDNAGIRRLLPEAGPAVVGATFCSDDGTTNPFHLLRALLSVFERRGDYRPGHPVERLAPDGSGFRVETPQGDWLADRVILTAGLGNKVLAPGLGLFAPIRPVRGQILVTEKLKSFLRYGISFIRQTVEGGVIFGESSEEAGLDDRTTPDVIQTTAQRAVAALPLLANAQVVRSWAALRVMSPDGMPVYAESAAHPGAFLVTVHSGVTLAPFHAGPLATALSAGRLDPAWQPFSSDRFSVPAS
ncbi:FAD-binding oxidoreductase [Bosea sp. SSUT16]|jgi:glycine/D-amino acid oxidase-like deaminating enzyme|uniref:FAD-binding oxidoreductase n=1 Tax=Bosea spartocytisi TaxID=2773451 RepID=A0A927EFW6_9HYPH|nr:FAD-dependent oxidoreductase [Bosea spartocytisi]MBD3848629.1 FAD-binding oxidoreductase [Bosea spartocytisi]MCT4475077.1 FAD-binding oxidoreductase [Bosea spartocytisi]